MKKIIVVKEWTHRRTKGSAVFMSVLLFLSISLMIVAGTAGPIVREFNGARNTIHSTKTYYIAEAGLEDAYYRLKNGMTVASPIVYTVGDGIATTTVTDLGGGNWDVLSAGARTDFIRKIHAVVSDTVVDTTLPYGAQIGDGGVVMENNAGIRGASGGTGDVYSNGSVIGSSGTTITGNITVSTGIIEELAQRSIVCNQEQLVGKAPTVDVAQSFVAPTSTPLAKIAIYIKKNHSNPNDGTIKIVSDVGGVPGVAVLAEGEVNESLTGAGYAWIDVLFASPATLSVGSTYWIVFDTSSHGSKNWSWCSDSGAGYAGGVAKYSADWGSGPWSAIASDMTFKLFWGSGFSIIENMGISGIAKANTIKDSTIGGDAYYQTLLGTVTVGGTSYPGSSDPPVIPMPFSDANIASWKSVAENGGVITGNCPGSVGCSSVMGPVKIDGDLTIPIGDTFTITGTVYVTGKVFPENLSKIQCTGAFAEQSCLLLADGAIDVSNNASFAGSGNAKSFLLALSTVEGCIGGVQQTWCAPNNSAIYVANQATGVILYAKKSQIYINNGVDVTTVIAHKLHLSQTATVTYDVNLADVKFSSGPDGGWVVNVWKEVD